MKRFLPVPLNDSDRQTLIEFLEGQGGGQDLKLNSEGAEESLRLLLHLIMSSTEYQLS